MLILTGFPVGDKQEALCSVCHKVVGEFTQEELGELCKSLDAIYCFECDPILADSVHWSLYDDSGRYLLRLGGTWISVNLWGEVRAKSKQLSQKNIKLAQLYEHLLSVFGGKNDQ